MTDIHEVYKHSKKEYVATIHVMVEADNHHDAHKKLAMSMAHDWKYAMIPSNTKSLARHLNTSETSLPSQVPSHSRITVYYLQDDKDYVEDGSGNVRKVYGVGVYNAMTGDLIERVYNGDEQFAEEDAVELCMRCGWNVVHPEEVSPYDIVMPGYAP